MERRIVIEGIPLTTKASVGSISTLAFDASHEARRRMAVFSIQLTRKPHRTSEPRGLSPSGGIFAANSHVSLAPARLLRAVRGQGVLPLARAARPVAERRYFAANSHVSLCPCAPQARSPGSRGTTPCANREARRRAAVFRSQFTCLSTPLRAVGAQSERGTQSPILPRTMKRAPSKV